jgi:glycosyltransferase involved in cell wall biosynthesis
LDSDCYEVVFVVGSGNRLIQEAQDAGFEVVIQEHLRSEISLVHDRAAFADLKAFCRTGRFDVVHTHSAKAGALGRLAARDAQVGRIVHTYHGFPFHDFQSRIRRQTYIRIERSLARFTDAFLAVGPAVAAEAIVRRIAPPERVRTIGVAVSNGRAPDLSDQAEARRLLGVPPGMRVVGTVGRLDFQKAPEDFVNALARLHRSDIYGVWIGDGPLRAKTEKLAARRGLKGRMSFLGERSDVANLLPGLDVFAMASRYEGLPCAIVEAMAAARPVVATAVNSVPNVVITGETGLLVPPGRPDLLSRALAYLIDNPAVADRLGRTGRAHLGDELCPAALGAVLDETYRPEPNREHPTPRGELEVLAS